MKLLLTGSLGFIASNFIRRTRFLKKNYKIVGVDKIANTARLNNIYINRDYYTCYIGDICDEHFIDVLISYEQPDVIVHMAAETAVDASIENPNRFVHSNVIGTQVLINAAIKHKIKKFIYTSTDEVYGSLPDESTPKWTEESIPNPRNPYSASKLSGEFLIKAAANTYGLEYCITRSSNNYGPWQTSDKLIPRVIKCITENKPIPVYGNGLNVRDWMHVNDNCDGIIKVIENGKAGEVYNISANQEFSNLETVQLICNAAEAGHSNIKFVEDRKGHDFRYAIDNGKLKALGWNPQTKFKDGIKQVVNWYLANKYTLL